VLDDAAIQRTLAAALRTGGEFAEVFVEDKRSSSAMLDDGRVEELSSGRDRGAGIRVVVGETTGFAHTADLSDDGLRTAAEAAAAAARSGGGGVREVALTRRDAPRPNEVAVLPETVSKGAKVDLLRRADSAARATGGSIRQVRARYGDSRRQILVANSEGLLASDDQVRTLFVVSAVASGDTGMQTGYESIGRTVGFELFDRYEVDDIARTAAQRAITKLAARPAPSGTLPVVIGPGGGGVLFHEACGHGLEKDLVDKGASVFTGKLGEQVASPLVTLVDDGTMGEEWGCFAIDDEGTPAQRNVLIEDGVLTDYMWDMLRSRKDGRARSGNGRRQSYQHLPMVRMTNTYLLGGEGDPADIVSSTDHGVYVASLGGGQVNTASGDFVFGMTEAYLIEDGVLTDYMWDMLRSRKDGRARSGNGRRQSYQHLPMVRMTNTYLLGGEGDPADIVSSTDHGVYVASLGGGQVNTASGDFVFGMTEAYLIEDGKITEPLREGNLIGNGPKVLADIDAVGNDFSMGHPGTCGKDGQGVPVGDGVPTLRVKALTVGGTAA
jgi:TldD protein